jgi:hypothetical protein
LVSIDLGRKIPRYFLRFSGVEFVPILSSSNCFQNVPISFATYFDTLRVAVAQITDYDVFLLRMHMWDCARAGYYAFSAGSAGFAIDEYSTSFLAHRKSVDGA